MTSEIFTLCDAAADYSGRLNILGVFDTIFAASLPAVHAQCSVALRLRFAKVEEGKHSLTLHIVDNDGNMVVPALNGDFGIQLQGPEKSGAINLVLNLQGLSFSAYGEYAVNLAIDNREINSLRFWVKAPR